LIDVCGIEICLGALFIGEDDIIVYFGTINSNYKGRYDLRQMALKENVGVFLKSILQD
jgi:hypothetical protein